MRILFKSLLILLLLGLGSATAVADEDYEFGKGNWPLSVIERPLTLAGSMLEVTGDTLIINMSADTVGDPIWLAPDIFYGINNRFTVGVTHNRGLCVSGNLCDDPYDTYNDLGIDAIYSLMRAGNLQIAARGGLAFADFDPFTAGLSVGTIVRVTAGSIAVRIEPGLYVGAIERDTRKEMLSVPVWVQIRINNQTTAFISSGLFGPLDGFGDNYSVPTGLGATFAINNRLDVGAEFVLTNLGGKDDSEIGKGGFDLRELIIRGAVRL